MGVDKCKGLPLPMGIYWQAHANVWQAACAITAGTALQPYIKPVGCLYLNPKQLANIWYVLIVSYDLVDLQKEILQSASL